MPRATHSSRWPVPRSACSRWCWPAAAALLLGAPGWLVEFAWVSFGLNAFNLLPLVPLDGGQYMNNVLFSRSPVMELVFRLLAIGVLFWFAVALEEWLLGILPLFMLLTIGITYRKARLINDARRDPIWPSRSLDHQAVASMRMLLARVFKGLPPEKYAKQLPEHVHGLWLELRKRFPGPGVTVALIAGYVILCAIIFPVVGMCLVTLLPRVEF